MRVCSTEAILENACTCGGSANIEQRGLKEGMVWGRLEKSWHTLVLLHLLDRVGQGDGNGEWQTLRHSDDDDCDRVDEEFHCKAREWHVS